MAHKHQAERGCGQCEGRQFGFCSLWTADESRLLGEIRQSRRTYEAGSSIYCQGEAAPNYAVVLGGWVGLVVTLPDGNCPMPDVALPGACLGFMPDGGAASSHSAVCLSDVTVCVLPRGKLDALVRSHPAFGGRLAALARCREARLRDHFVNVAGRVARDRVAHFLMELFVRSRRRLPRGGDRLDVPMSLAQIGQATSLSGEHVSRTLATLRLQGVVRFYRGRLDVIDGDAFRHAADLTAEMGMFADEAPVAA